ncbi:MAG: TlyA family RNA methyltransferase [Pseudomonadota bacterium]
MKKPEKKRLDQLLVERGLAESRHQARAIVLAGMVLVDGGAADKPGKEVSEAVSLSLKERPAYVGRGGLKLEAALDGFSIDADGLTFLDAGASTGGFTDCLLQRGAARVIAVDVGYGQFHWRLRSDPRVCLLERTNLRFLGPEQLPSAIDAAVADLSFISLELVLERIHGFLPPGGRFIPLVKPQFEVGKGLVGKGGVVRDPSKIREVVDAMKAAAERFGFEVLGELESPVRGPKGNREVFLNLRKI